MAEKKKPNKSSAADVDDKRLLIVFRRPFINTKELKQTSTAELVNPILEAEVQCFSISCLDF